MAGPLVHAGKPSAKLDRNMFLRVMSRITGHKGIVVDAHPAANVTDVPMNERSDEKDAIDRARSGGSFTVATDTAPLIENDDPARVRFRKRIRHSKLFKWVSLKLHMRELMPDEIREQEDQAARETMRRLWEPQARLAGRTLINTLTRLRFAHFRNRDGAEKTLREITFDIVKYSELAFYYHVGYVPIGVKTVEMATPEVCTELSVSVGHRVRAILDDNHGLIFVVEIASAMGIPEFVTFADQVEAMPKNLPPLSFPSGVASNGRRVYRSLIDMPHLLVAGGTGSGKSNMVNVIICSLILKHRPDEMQLVLFDLKRGVEFGGYEGLPHLLTTEEIPTGIVESLPQVIRAFECLCTLGDRRLDEIKKAGHRDITGYNRHKKSARMPRLVVIIDEWANIKLQLGRDAESLLTQITNLYRAAGIHVILATQNPKAEIINTVITTNFHVRMGFSMPTAASMAVLSNWSAAGLTPKGRYILQSPSEEIQLQAPRITDAAINSIVAGARTGRQVLEDSATAGVDPIEILEWALDNQGGRVPVDKTFEHFSQRVRLAELRELLSTMDGQTFDVRGVAYRLLPARGSVARKMELVETVDAT